MYFLNLNFTISIEYEFKEFTNTQNREYTKIENAQIDNREAKRQ